MNHVFLFSMLCMTFAFGTVVGDTYTPISGTGGQTLSKRCAVLEARIAALEERCAKLEMSIAALGAPWGIRTLPLDNNMLSIGDAGTLVFDNFFSPTTPTSK